ncbi:MAG: chorismate mutase [Clostridia bacterium]|nr:chorismate mutase [Clostridia bacterium]
MDQLKKARQTINEVDRRMAELFIKRMEAAKEVGRYKKEHALQITDPAREEEVIERNSAYVEDETLRTYYVSFLRHNMELSKALQHRLLDGMRVAYSGVEGAFANIAALRAFPDAIAVPYPDFRSAYEAVENDECDCVILPVENSSNGDVGQVMDLAFFGSLHINGIYDIDVVQNLLAVPGTKLEEVKEVISHPQALGQCADYIHRHGFTATQVVNTAVAAQQVAESGRHDIAAIASEEAGEKYGLQKLESHINGSNVNTTRFAVFSRAAKTETERDNQFVMLFTVTNEAGALGRAISIIGEHGFNLRALKSRPNKELAWSYYFYAEGEGNINTEEGENMLADLRGYCNSLRIIGSFEKEMSL